MFGLIVASGVFNIFSIDLGSGDERLLLADAPPTTYSVAYPTWQPRQIVAETHGGQGSDCPSCGTCRAPQSLVTDLPRRSASSALKSPRQSNGCIACLGHLAMPARTVIRSGVRRDVGKHPDDPEAFSPPPALYIQVSTEAVKRGCQPRSGYCVKRSRPLPC